MKRIIKSIFFLVLCMTATIKLFPLLTYAWGDNGGGRPEYTIEEIDNGAIGDTNPSSENYPGTIVFNSISDSVIGHEFNFVGARKYNQRADGTWIGATKDTTWNGNEIEVSGGQTYIIRAYVHNNNPNGEDAIAEDTKVEFIVPTNSAREIEVNGVISSSNATPSRYWDHVTFKSSRLFHLEYIENSALLENNGIGKGGIQLSDDILKDGGTLIGYDKLDGCIPGCYEYDGYVTIMVRAVFDDFIVKTQVRHVGDKEWQDSIDAEVGDKVEFQIEYQNDSGMWQNDVVIQNILPPNFFYVAGSTKIKNSNYPNGATVNEDHIIGDGIQVGNYGPDANVYVIFTAEVVDDSLANGQNTLINWGYVFSNGEELLKDEAKVIVQKRPKNFMIRIILLSVGIFVCLIITILLIRKIVKNNQR